MSWQKPIGFQMQTFLAMKGERKFKRGMQCIECSRRGDCPVNGIPQYPCKEKRI